MAARANSLNGSDVYRINDLVFTEEEWRQATVLKYASAPALSHLHAATSKDR